MIYSLILAYYIYGLMIYSFSVLCYCYIIVGRQRTIYFFILYLDIYFHFLPF